MKRKLRKHADTPINPSLFSFFTFLIYNYNYTLELAIKWTTERLCFKSRGIFFLFWVPSYEEKSQWIYSSNWPLIFEISMFYEFAYKNPTTAPGTLPSPVRRPLDNSSLPPPKKPTAACCFRCVAPGQFPDQIKVVRQAAPKTTIGASCQRQRFISSL